MKVIINVDVPELAPAIEFYTAALGLTHSRTLDDDVAEPTGASATLYLLQKDVATAAARALAAGAKQETGCVIWRGSRCISFGDPFGHGFCFIQFERNPKPGGPRVRPLTRGPPTPSRFVPQLIASRGKPAPGPSVPT